MVPAKPASRRRSRLRRRERLGPAPTTMAASPAPSGVSASSRTERAMREWFVSALASPTPATRSKVADSSASAIFRPSSIRLRLVLVPVPRSYSARLRLRLALPHEALLAHEADAAAKSGERFLLELVGRVGGVRLVLDLRVQLVVALEELRHAQLLLAPRAVPSLPLPFAGGVAGRLRVRNFCSGMPMRPSSASRRSGFSKVAITMPSTSADGRSATGWMVSPRNWPPPSPAKMDTGSSPNSLRVR